MNKPKLHLLQPKASAIRHAEETKLQKGGFWGGMSKAAAKSIVGKYEVNWEAVEKAKTADNRPMFTRGQVWREKYFSWIPGIGHSGAFTDQVRREIATELADQEFKYNKEYSGKTNKEKEVIKEQAIDKYKAQLKDRSVKDLLNVRKRAFIAGTRTRSVFVDRVVGPIDAAIKDPIKRAILSLNEKYLNEIGRAIPGGKEEDVLIDDFVKSNTFTNHGGKSRALNHEEMEDALLDYMGGRYADQTHGTYSPGECESENFKLDKAQILQISLDKEKEKETIEELKSNLHPTIDRKTSEEIIISWQIEKKHKKDAGKNREEVKDVIARTHVDVRSAIFNASSKMPRKKGETIENYKDRLIPAIEDNLENNDIARLAYKNELEKFLAKEQKKLDEQKIRS